MVRPGIIWCNANLRDSNCPGQHPEDIADQGLIQIPSWPRGKKDSGELCRKRVENVTPIDGPPHLCCNSCYFPRARNVVCEAAGSVKRKEQAYRHFNRESHGTRSQRCADNICTTVSSCCTITDISFTLTHELFSRSAWFLIIGRYQVTECTPCMPNKGE